MKNSALVFLAWLALAAIPSQALSQEGSIELPSISAEAGHVFIANRTGGEVVFYLESANTTRTEHRLPPNSSATFSGDPSDSWFNIYISSKDTQVTYGLDAGTRHYFEWNSSGVLDVFKMPAR